MRRAVLWTSYVVLLAFLTLATLELAARWVGFGDPVLYYNAAWGGIRPLPDQQSKRLQGATVTIDKNGFRTAHPEKPGALRVLFIGDSVTWGGSRVDDAALFSEVAADVLRARGQPVYAMNAGVNATALVNQAEVFRQEVNSADVLVWLFPWGDVYRSYFAGLGLWPPHFKPHFALVEVIDIMIVKYWANLFRDLGSSAAGEEFSPVGMPPAYQGLFQKELEQRKSKNLEALRSVLSEAKLRKMQVIIGITPNVDDGHLISLNAEEAALLHDVAATGVDVIDVQAALKASSQPVGTLFLDSVHFSTLGHRVLGNALGQALAAVEGATPRSTP